MYKGWMPKVAQREKQIQNTLRLSTWYVVQNNKMKISSEYTQT